MLNATGAAITGALTATSGDITAALVAGSITTSHLAASAVTAAKIAAGTITADKLSVSTLSAIAADLGTVTAGSISGATATFGGGNLTLDSGGLTFAAGTGSTNSIIWSNGVTIYGWGVGQTLTLNAAVTEINQTLKVYGATIEFGTIGADTGTNLVLNGSSLVKTDSSSIRYKENIRRWDPRF